MSEPTTAAGRALNRWRVAIKADEDWSTLTDAILVIEVEARADALREAAERVRRLPQTGRGGMGNGTVMVWGDPSMVDVAAVLAALSEIGTTNGK